MEGRAGLTLGAVLEKEKDRPLRANRTLLDIISQEEPKCRVYSSNLIDHHHNKKGWKSLKDRLRLMRGCDGDVWAARVPASDGAFNCDLVSTSNATRLDAGSENNQRPALAQLLRDHSVRVVEPVQEDEQSGEVPWVETGQVQLHNQSLSQVVSSRRNNVDQEDSLHIEHVPVLDVPVPVMNSMSSMLVHNLLQIPSPGQSEEPVRSVRLSEALAAEREQMRMAVSSTEAARSAQDEEEVTESNNDDEARDEISREAANEQQQVRMSLMDLLEETDRLIGWSSYSGDVGDNNENTDEGNENDEVEGSNAVEQNCCVCMVRHKGSAFIPCGHTFCRLCSRELWVNRGNCPICNGFILEILDIF